jgi:hypothetical protein
MVGFLIWWKKLRPYITLLLIGMHIGIYYSMNIWFLSFMIELIIIGFPWYKWINNRFGENALSKSRVANYLLQTAQPSG